MQMHSVGIDLGKTSFHLVALGGSVQIAKAAASQQQGGQQKGIGLDDPLNVRRRYLKVSLQPGQREVDHGSVDKRHAGSNNGCNQYPWSAISEPPEPEAS